MELDPVILSRIQFGFLITFHIIFPAFTIGLGAWLATLEGMRLATDNPIYRRVFDFWIRIFAVSFAMGVVTGIVMAFQFGTNWGVLSERTGPIQGPLLGYEAFTAFMLEVTFFGVMLLGRARVGSRFYFFACCMVSLGTMFSSFWILANNSWMQVPVGHTIVDGKIIPADWREIVLGPVMMVRCPTKPLESTQAAQIKALLPTGDAYDHIDQLNNAVTALKAEGTSPALVIDRLIASYCPLVATDSSPTDAQKSASVMRFAARITRTVYSLDGADAIILDVLLPPAMVNAINAKAAGISPDAWIQSAVAAALQ